MANKSEPAAATPNAARDDVNCAIRPPDTMHTPGASIDIESARLIKSAIQRSGVRSWIAVRHATHSTLLPAPATADPQMATMRLGATVITAKPAASARPEHAMS